MKRLLVALTLTLAVAATQAIYAQEIPTEKMKEAKAGVEKSAKAAKDSVSKAKTKAEKEIQ